jgi:hypothetical protein
LVYPKLTVNTDTLFTSQNVSRLTGVLLPNVNDTWVFRLLLEKSG